MICFMITSFLIHTFQNIYWLLWTKIIYLIVPALFYDLKTFYSMYEKFYLHFIIARHFNQRYEQAFYKREIRMNEFSNAIDKFIRKWAIKKNQQTNIVALLQAIACKLTSIHIKTSENFCCQL